jgi:hypothetical protein
VNVQRMRASTEKWPLSPASKAGRCGSLVKWAKPNPIRRERRLANGRRVLPNRGDVLPVRGR